MAERSDKLVGLLRIMTQRFCDVPQDPLRHAMRAHPDLKSSRAQPRLVEFPTMAHFTQHLRLRNAAVLENQLARFGPRDRRDAARNSIARCSGIDQKASHPLATLRAWQPRKELHKVRHIGEGWKHLGPVDNEVITVRNRGRLEHGGIGTGGRFAQAEGRSLFSTNARQQKPLDLLAGATIKDIRNMVAELKGDGCFLKLLGYGHHGDIADIESAVFFRNVEIPKTGDLRFLLQALHDFDVTMNLRISAQLRA